MSKNLTRKGLAFGALVALGSSVLAGAPAYAADAVVLAANYSHDTTLAAPTTGAITLNASLAPGSTAANISQLKYKIVNNGTVRAVSATATSGNVAGSAVAVAASASGYIGDAAGELTLPTSQYSNTLALSLTSGAAADATSTVVVTAFLDSNLNNLVDTSETQQSVTVTFVKHSEITATTTITAPVQGDTAVVALVKYTNINNQALTAANLGAYFTKGDGTSLIAADGPIAIASGATNTLNTGVNTVVTGTHTWTGTPVVTVAGLTPSTLNGTYTTTAVTSTSVSYTNATATGTTSTAGTVKRINANVVQFNAAYSTTKGGFEYTTGTVDALAKGSAVEVTPLLKTSAIGVADYASTIATANSASVTARKVSTFTADTVTSVTAAAATAAASVSATNVALNKEYQVEFVAKDGTSPTPLAVAGVPVKITVTSPDRTLSSTVTLAVNGTTYTANTALPGYNSGAVAALAATTDSSGKVTVTLKGTGLTANDDVVVTAVAENFTASIITNNQALAYTTSYIANAPLGVAVTTDGAAANLNVVVKDQFGGNAPDATYDVTATWDATGAYVAQTTASTNATQTYAAVVGGKATLTITDNGTGTGVHVYDIDLKTKATNGVYSATAAIVADFQIHIVSAADAAPGAVKLTTTAGGAELAAASATDTTYVLAAAAEGGSTGPSSVRTALETGAFANYDSRNVIDALPASTTRAVTLYGTVYSASTATYAGVPVANSKVTLTAAGLAFAAADQGTLHGDGALSVYTDANGRFTVTVGSHMAGKQTVTVTSGAGTSKVYLYFGEAAVANASAVTVTVADGAAQFQAGRALDVTVKVTDKFGNPIATTAAAGTDTGNLSVTQTGSGYLSLSGSSTATNGIATAADGTFKTKLITNAGDLGTSTITATVDLATNVTATTSSEFGVTDVTDISSAGKAIYVNTEFAKGKVVTVYIDGKRMPTKAAEATDNAVERKYTQKKAGKHTVTVRVSGGVVASETVVTTK